MIVGSVQIRVVAGGSSANFATLVTVSPPACKPSHIQPRPDKRYCRTNDVCSNETPPDPGKPHIKVKREEGCKYWGQDERAQDRDNERVHTLPGPLKERGREHPKRHGHIEETHDP